MTRMVASKHIEGRTIVGLIYEPRRCPNRGIIEHHNVRILLDDGSTLFFTAEETETPDYGITVTRYKPRKVAR